MISSLHRVTKLFDVIRPIALSALSIFICFLLIQPVALWCDPAFSLLANRGLGKIAFTLVVMMHLLLLAATHSNNEWKMFWHSNAAFLGTRAWLKPFFAMFGLFAALHTSTLLALSLTPWANAYLPTTLSWSVLPSLALGFVATFFLAWTEEAIFRGTIIPLLLRGGLSKTASILLSALIFMLAHDITAPWHLLSSNLPLGIGLFLLGILLAQLFVMSGTLYVGMGAHAGLVFVKVFLRRIPCLAYASNVPWWLHSDLRQSPLIHALFALLICWLFWSKRKHFFR